MSDRPSRCRLAARAAFLCLALPLPSQSPAVAPSERGAAVEPVDFNRDVRPILSDRCFKCHGFDPQGRKAGLRLDTWEGLTADHEGRTPVVPGEPDRSELIRRVESDDPKIAMPHPKSGLELSADERRLLRRWIQEGAPFARHWAFLPPRAPALPDGATPAHPVDRFVHRKLRDNGLRPSPPAERTTLIRRVSLDLTGLPPTPEEVDAFVRDDSPDAYEKLVDRLLASPHFGERLALVWLDAARYADTNGFHHDNIRTVWPYRDWVIDAFNRNLPYDRFVVEQLAGDLLEEPTAQQRIATAFCRMHNINDEGGALDEEYRVEAVCDRIETVATTFMGLTFTCCRCHDHKYDPFTQDDYYSLSAIFNSVDERGVYANNFEQARAYPARLDYRPGDLEERLAAATAELESAEAARTAAEPAIAAELAQWEWTRRRERSVRWVDTQLVDVRSAAGVPLRPLADGSAFADTQADADTHTFVLRTDATGLRLLRFEALADARLPGVGIASHGNAVVSRITARATSLVDPQRSTDVVWSWAWADHEQPNADHDILNVLRDDPLGWALDGHNRKDSRTALLVASQPFGYPGGTEITVHVDYRSPYPNHSIGRPRVTLAAASGDLEADFPTVAQSWFSVGPFKGKDFDDAYDRAYGPEGGAFDLQQRFAGKAWRYRSDLLDGEPLALKGTTSAFYFARELHTPRAREVVLFFGSDDALRVYLNGEQVHANKALRGVQPDQDRVVVTLRPGVNTLVAKVVNNGGPAGFYARIAPSDAPSRLEPVSYLPPAMRPATLADDFARDWGTARSQTYAQAAAAVEKARRAVAALERETVPVLVMQENEEPTPTFVLERGSYSAANPDRPVRRRPPSLFGDLAPDAPRNRLGFAQWLVDPDHPLTARVHVNRLWQMLFGTGIVASVENFGHQADWPSHPLLLDWLAVRFVESGWDQKALLRLLVTSATYRQSARVAPAARDRDPRNRLLAYFPRRRLAGELVRDQALFVAGLLRTDIGGPSVRPYQPAGLWREVSIGGSSNTQVFQRDDGDGLYRRSLYTFWKRTSPNPQMMTFDAPTREFCVVRRSSTNTPLQALVLWNDVQFVEAARVLAQRTLQQTRDPVERLTSMFRRCTGRAPRDAELTVLQRALRDFRARYAESSEDARALIAHGEAPLPENYAEDELAAWMMIGSTLLSLDETLVRN